jgi:hypothetical protein
VRSAVRRVSEGDDFQIPTTAVDRVLDELDSVDSQS